MFTFKPTDPDDTISTELYDAIPTWLRYLDPIRLDPADELDDNQIQSIYDTGNPWVVEPEVLDHRAGNQGDYRTELTNQLWPDLQSYLANFTDEEAKRVWAITDEVLDSLMQDCEVSMAEALLHQSSCRLVHLGLTPTTRTRLARDITELLNIPYGADDLAAELIDEFPNDDDDLYVSVVSFDLPELFVPANQTVSITCPTLCLTGRGGQSGVDVPGVTARFKLTTANPPVVNSLAPYPVK